MKIVPRVFEFTKADLVAALQSYVRKETGSGVVLDSATLEVHEEDRGSVFRVLLREAWSEPLVVPDPELTKSCGSGMGPWVCHLPWGHAGQHEGMRDGERGLWLNTGRPELPPEPELPPGLEACGELFVASVGAPGRDPRPWETTCTLPKGHLGIHASVTARNAVLATQGTEVPRCPATQSVGGGCMGYPDLECQLSARHPGRHIAADGTYFDALTD